MYIKGKAKKGIGLGSKIGYPTINLKIIKIKGNIPYGVYTCYLVNRNNKYKGVLHYGPKSVGTAAKDHIYCEVYLIDYVEGLENYEIKLEVLKKIRNVRKFESEYELKNQIKKDLQSANKLFKEND
jgi:FAD synthase